MAIGSPLTRTANVIRRCEYREWVEFARTLQPWAKVVRAVITEILTAHFFVTRPHYLKTMQKLAEIDLRI